MLLLEQFENLTLHPKNAARLKELVLQLAAQGKLTENWRRQNPDVEPAAELLKRIEAEKAQLVKEKKIKKEKPLEPISEDEIPYTLPESWVWCKLGSITNYGTSEKVEPKQADDDLWVLELEDVEKSTSKLLKKVRYSDRNFQSTKSRFFKGDVIYGKLRPYLDKVIVADESGVCTTEMIPFRGYGEINPFFLRLLLKDPSFIKYANDSTHGMNLPRMGTDKAREALLALPPLAEQEAIVVRVEELMQKIEELEKQTTEPIKLKQHLGAAALQQLTTAPDEELEQNWLFLKQHFQTIFDEAANVRKLRETILQLAVQGKLTATWRNQNPTTEPASELLKRIQAEKAQLVKEKKIKKEKPLEPISEDEVPYTLPDGWVWCRLQDVGCLDRGKSKHRPRNDVRLFSGGTFPLVQTGDVSASKLTDGLILTHKSEYNDFGLAQSRMWPKGTLCITIAANIAETGFLGYDACFPDSVVGFSGVLEGSLVNYVKFFIDTSKNHLLEYAPSTAQKNINLGILSSMLFPLPPAAEQHAIVEQANKLIQLCDELDQLIKQSKLESEALMQAVVQEALQVQQEEVV